MPFAAGQRVRASQLSAVEAAVTVAAVNGTNTGGVNTTSTSYVALSGNPGAVFVAPANGVVMIVHACSCAGSAVGIGAWTSPEIRTGGTIGSGTLVRAAEDLTAVMVEGAISVQASLTFFQGGLTAGSTYNVRMLYRASGAGTAYFARRGVTVMPMPGLA